MRYLAIDHGIKRTGLAVSDASETFTTPLAVITGSSELIPRILNFIESEAIEAIVIGLPLNMDGSEGPQSKIVRDFAEKLKKDIEIPIHFHDERLSSFNAEKKTVEWGLTRKKKKKRLDAIAAADILQSFLEGKQNS